MGKTKIEWTATQNPDGSLTAGFSWNAWVGCAEVSPGCSRCYAKVWAKRSGHPELWEGERRRTTPANWAKPHKWNREEGLDYQEGMRISRPRVFTNSLADFMDNQVPVQWRREAWHVIDQTPNLDYLILTKRPQNIIKMLPEPDAGYTKPWGPNGWPNVWLGMTAENQEEYDRRASHLYAVPAAVHFISYEPALGPLVVDQDAPLDWLICGAESGPHARPMDLAWARAARDQCKRQGIFYFFKQMGGKRKPFPPIPADLLIREWPRGVSR